MILVPPTDPVLWTRAEPVMDIAAQVAPFVDEMVALMRKHDGIGLAAPQVGIPLRFFVTRFDACSVVINPVIRGTGCSATAEEGCLSLPGFKREVERPYVLFAQWLDLEGRQVTERLSGMMARVWLHEHDHLEGRLIATREEAASLPAGQHEDRRSE